jgi:hypothetical protein
MCVLVVPVVQVNRNVALNPCLQVLRSLWPPLHSRKHILGTTDVLDVHVTVLQGW